MNCKFCKKPIEEGRVELNLTCCLSCASKGLGQPPKLKGIMVYGHKTAATLCITTDEGFADFRRLSPYGRNTGRGSGVHAVSRKLTK